jgi:hypothetical protein
LERARNARFYTDRIARGHCDHCHCKAKEKAQVAKARTEIHSLLQAINQYEGDYHRLPTSPNTRMAAVGVNNDFTFGTTHTRSDGSTVRLTRRGDPNARYGFLEDVFSEAQNQWRASNAEVVSILRDTETFRDGTRSMNYGHVLNPQRNVYLDVRDVDRTTLSGVGPDGVYRDPWGNPYIISMDLNADQKCHDAFYRLGTVSQDPTQPGGGVLRGLNGLVSSGGANDFQSSTPVMVWSFGPDSAINAQIKATFPPNKDNVISW